MKIKEFKNAVKQFIIDYHKEIWNSKSKHLKSDKVIMIITKLDIIYWLGTDITLAKFNEICEHDQKFNQLVNEFITNNFIHFASSTKMKDLLEEYKENSISIERNEFKVDYSMLSNLNDILVKSGNKVSLGLDNSSDLDEKYKDIILANVEKFN